FYFIESEVLWHKLWYTVSSQQHSLARVPYLVASVLPLCMPRGEVCCSWELDVYGGLILFCGFVLFDTQLIVERFNNGDNDYVRHSLDLFLDFINIFRRLLVILASKEKKRKN
ncbi:Bax inhibitor 1, partial [Geodia barretti]